MSQRRQSRGNKHRRKLRSPILLKAKNMVRGSKDPAAALIQAIQEVPKNLRSQLISWAESVRFGRRTALPSAFPSELRFLLTSVPAELGDFGDEISSLTSRLVVHESRIHEFVSAKLALEEAVLRGRYSDAEQILNQIENGLGQSLWLIEEKIAVTALGRGLEAQKKLTEDIKAVCESAAITTIAHHVSQRNESSTSPARFAARVNDLIDKSKITRASKLFYKFTLTGDIAGDQESTQLILLHMTTASLVDAYEAFIALSMESAARQLGLPEKEILHAVATQGGFNSDRLSKLRFIANICDDSELRIRDLQLDHALIANNQAFLTSPHIADLADPRSIWVEAFFRVLADRPLAEMNTQRDELVGLIHTLLSNVEKAEEATEVVVRLGLNLKASPVIRVLVQLALDLTSDAPPLSKERHYRALLNSPYLDPWDLLFVPEEVRYVYLQALVNRYGEVPLVRFVAWLSGSSSLRPTEGVSDEFHLFADTYRAFQAEDYAAAALLALKLETISAFQRMAIRWHCNALLAEELDREVIRFAACRLSRSSAYYSVLPINRLLEGKKWKDLEAYANEIALAVLIDVRWRRTGSSELNSFRRYAAEDFVLSQGLRRPSELGSKQSEIDKTTLIYFLTNVCTPDVLDLMTIFPSSRSVQEERRAVCALLVELDPESAERHREEITRITGTLMLEEGVRSLDQSRVFVDKEGVVRWAERELKENFDRYRALHKAGVGFDASDFMVALKEFLVNQQPMPGQFLEVPKGEADDLFLETISEIRDNFLLSPTHGLDSYLSLRVRHGTLSGMLRGPLEQNHIINQRKSGTTRYQRNTHWADALFGASPEQIERIERAIMSLSEGYDAAINELRNRLQIRRRERPNGLFDIALNAFHVHFLKSVINADTKLEDFVRECVDIYWLSLNESLNNVQRYIGAEFRTTIAGLFEKLETDLQDGTQGSRHPALIDAVRQSKTEVQAVLENISSWFHRGAESKLSYPLGQAVDVAIEVVRTTYRSFSPQIEKLIPQDEELVLSSVREISDIIFTMLDNVYKHSGIDGSPRVWIEVKNRGDKAVELSVENEVSPEFDFEKGRREIAEVITRISRSEYKTAAVSAEGGSGLLKLKSHVDPSGSRPDALLFGFTEKGRFRVSVIIETFMG